MPRLEFWFEFASTYSYLSAMRIEQLAATRGVEIMWRPFLLGPIFAAQGMTTSPFNLYPIKGAYMWRDMDREAARMGLPPVVRPDPFPQNGMLAARVATLATGNDWQAAFVRGVYDAQFARGLDISSPDVVSDVLSALGQDPVSILERARNDRTVKDALRATTESARMLGIFGAPSFTAPDGEVFWGNDRLDAALDWVT